MKRLQTLAILLAVTFALAACGGGGTEQPEQADSPDGQGAAPATESNATEEEAAQEPEQGDRGGEDAGTTVTTLDGERVNVGEGEATALFFMAGW